MLVREQLGQVREGVAHGRPALLELVMVTRADEASKASISMRSRLQATARNKKKKRKRTLIFFVKQCPKSSSY